MLKANSLLVFSSLFSLLLVYFLLSLLLLLSKLKPSIKVGCGAGFNLLAGRSSALSDEELEGMQLLTSAFHWEVREQASLPTYM